MKDAPLLTVAGLSYRYAEGGLALDNVSLEVHEGETVALLGPNGAGKTTLLLHMAAVIPSARVSVCGLPAVHPHLREIRRLSGLVFQRADDQLFMPTVGEDVAFGPEQQGLGEEEVKARVTEALASVGMAGSEKRTPHRLSAGEKRAVAIATVLSMRPRILLLDEPTADLDPHARRVLLALLKKIGGAKVIALHDLEAALEICTRGVLLDRGAVVADRPIRELLQDERLLLEHGLEAPLSLRLEAAERRIAELEQRLRSAP